MKNLKNTRRCTWKNRMYTSLAPAHFYTARQTIIRSHCFKEWERKIHEGNHRRASEKKFA
jgi:hypothetical protein